VDITRRRLIGRRTTGLRTMPDSCSTRHSHFFWGRAPHQDGRHRRPLDMPSSPLPWRRSPGAPEIDDGEFYAEMKAPKRERDLSTGQLRYRWSETGALEHFRHAHAFDHLAGSGMGTGMGLAAGEWESMYV
jgi:hypothetical protein